MCIWDFADWVKMFSLLVTALTVKNIGNGSFVYARSLSKIREGFHFFLLPPFLSYCVLFFVLPQLHRSGWNPILLYGLNTSVGESKSSSGQLVRSPTLARLNPSASSPNFFKYLRHNSSGEQSGHFAQKR